MNVLVTGGTGFVGTALCSELAERGHDVTALARSPEDTDQSAGAGAGLPDAVGTCAGDVTDFDSIEGAFAGRDAVVNLVALSPLFEPAGGTARHFDVHLGGTENVVRAAEAAGVDRVVQVSALGADPDGPTAYVRAKGAAEAVVRESDVEGVVVRPSVVFGDGGEFLPFTELLTTPYVTALPGGGKTRFQPVWVSDLAPMLAEAVEGDDHAGETYEVGGPEVLTLADVARAVYRAGGRSLRVVPVPMGADQYRSLRFDNTVEDNDAGTLERPPASLRTLGDYLHASTGGSGSGSRAAERPTGGNPSASDGRRSLFVAGPVLAVFFFLTAAWSLQYVVDVYVHPVVRWTFAVPYAVTLVLFDNGVTEAPVYALDGVVPVPGPVLWEAGNVITYYLVALAVGVALRVVGRSRGGNRNQDENGNESGSDGDEPSA